MAPRYKELDPKEFYYYSKRAAKSRSDAQGVEWFAYELFGTDLMAYIALAIDPLRPFRRIGAQATPVNRTRKFTAHGTPNTIRSRTVSRSILGTQPPDTATPDPTDRLAYSETCTTVTSTTVPIAQLLINGESLDTTRKTRPLSSGFGEFELWKPRISAKGGGRTTIADENVYTSPPNYRTRDCDVVESHFIGPCARITPTTVNNLRAGMKTQLLADMGDNVVKLLSRVNPNKREFALGYSVAELKDLPRSYMGAVKSLVEARAWKAGRVRGNRSKSAAREFVSLEFGWKQLYQDIDRLVNLPERLSKKLNFLMDRNGKLTTLRTTLKLAPVPVTSPPTFTHSFLNGESQVSLGHEAVIRNEIRLAVNTLIDFPRLNVPRLREDFYLHNIGADPTPEDVYNLIPWSWLIDWFTGIGDYVSLYDNVNLDPDLVNYGFVTGVSTLSSRSVLCARRVSVDSVSITPPIPPTVVQTVKQNELTREARLETTLQIRRSITNAYGVKPAWDLGSLSDFQASILGALLFVQVPRIG